MTWTVTDPHFRGTNPIVRRREMAREYVEAIFAPTTGRESEAIMRRMRWEFGEELTTKSIDEAMMEYRQTHQSGE